MILFGLTEYGRRNKIKNETSNALQVAFSLSFLFGFFSSPSRTRGQSEFFFLKRPQQRNQRKQNKKHGENQIFSTVVMGMNLLSELGVKKKQQKIGEQFDENDPEFFFSSFSRSFFNRLEKEWGAAAVLLWNTVPKTMRTGALLLRHFVFNPIFKSRVEKGTVSTGVGEVSSIEFGEQ